MSFESEGWWHGVTVKSRFTLQNIIVLFFMAMPLSSCVAQTFSISSTVGITNTISISADQRALHEGFLKYQIFSFLLYSTHEQ
jgi:hypothetical protein